MLNFRKHSVCHCAPQKGKDLFQLLVDSSQHVWHSSHCVCNLGCGQEQSWKSLSWGSVVYISILSLSFIQVRTQSRERSIYLKRFALWNLGIKYLLLNSTNFRLSLCVSIYMVVAVSCERFLAVTRPKVRLVLELFSCNLILINFRLHVSPLKRSMLNYILPVMIVAALLNVAKFFEVDLVSNEVDIL